MTTDAMDMEQATEEQMGRLVSDLASGMEIMLFSLGTRSGLWSALAGAGPLTSAEVSARVAVDPALVREWLRSQAAGGYLEYDAQDDTFHLPEAGAAVFVDGPGGPLVEACLDMVRSMGSCYDDFSTAFSNGQGFGWHQRSLQHWHGTDGMTRVALPAELVAAAISQLAGVPEALDAGGSVLDVGCGFGAPTLAIAQQHHSARVLGVDYHDASIMHARDAAAHAATTNVRFEVAPADHLPGAEYDLVTFFDSLHDIGDPRGALTSARKAVSEDGAVLLFEPLGADSVADNLNPNGRMFYSISTLACTPNAVSQRTVTSSEPLGAQAGERALREVATEAGFSRVHRVDVSAPLNLVLELRP